MNDRARARNEFAEPLGLNHDVAAGALGRDD